MNFDLKKYSDLLGLMESTNNYKIINAVGALGKYQFMPTTLNSLQNLYNLPAWKNAGFFTSNPELQEKYLAALVNDSIKQIQSNGLDKYYGVITKGRLRFSNIQAPVNIYGLLASIHLSGAGNVKKYFINGHDPDDGFTSLSDYLTFFSYKLQNASNSNLLILAFISAIVLYLT